MRYLSGLVSRAVSHLLRPAGISRHTPPDRFAGCRVFVELLEDRTVPSAGPADVGAPGFLPPGQAALSGGPGGGPGGSAPSLPPSAAAHGSSGQSGPAADSPAAGAHAASSGQGYPLP